MKIYKWFFIISTICALVTFTGCSTIDRGFSKIGYQKIEQANNQIAQIQATANKQQQDLTNKINTENAIIVKALKDSLQGAANELFAANYAFSLDTKPNRLGIVVNYHVKGAQTYIRVAPTVESMQNTLTEVKNELDETKTTVADLQAKYELEVKKADQIQNDKKIAEDQIILIQKQKEEVENKKKDDIAAIQKQKDIETQKVLDMQEAEKQKLEQDAKDKKSRESLIRILMISSGALSVGFLIAAIYAPLFKKESGITSGILGLVTIALPFIEPWMVGITFGAIAIGLISWLMIKHHTDINTKDKALEVESRATKNLTNAIQDIKEKSSDVYKNTIQPVLKEWNTVVTQNPDGSITKTVDNAVEKLIDQKLIQSDRK